MVRMGARPASRLITLTPEPTLVVAVFMDHMAAPALVGRITHTPEPTREAAQFRLLTEAEARPQDTTLLPESEQQRDRDQVPMVNGVVPSSVMETELCRPVMPLLLRVLSPGRDPRPEQL